MDAQGFERSYTVNSSILLAIQPHLIHFHQLLLQPPKVNKIKKGGSQLRSHRFVSPPVDLGRQKACHNHQCSVVAMLSHSFSWESCFSAFSLPSVYF